MNPQFSFYVPGPPVSLQAKNRKRLQAWKQRVRDAAERIWSNRQAPAIESLRCEIWYFYDQEATGDVDNIIKPILNVLVGLVYVDDRQITDLACRKRESHTPFVFHTISDTLLDGLTQYNELLYVIVSTAPNPQILEV